MSPKEIQAMQAIVDELLAKRLIRATLSPCTMPTMLVSKKDGSWQLCVKYKVSIFYFQV